MNPLAVLFTWLAGTDLGALCDRRRRGKALCALFLASPTVAAGQQLTDWQYQLVYGPAEHRLSPNDPKRFSAKIPVAVANYDTRAFAAVSITCAYLDSRGTLLVTDGTVLLDVPAGLVGYAAVEALEVPATAVELSCRVDEISPAR